MSLNSDNSIQELVDFVNDLSDQLTLVNSIISSLQAGTISTLDLEDGCVTNPKLADDAVDDIKILDGSVTTPKLANNAVNQDKMSVTLYNSITRNSTESQTGRIQIATEVETLAGLEQVKAVVPAYLKSYVDDALASIAGNSRLPIGSLYLNGSSNTNPNTILGYGTWVKFGAGKFLVNIDGSQTEFDTIAETGGVKTHTHTLGATSLSISQLPPAVYQNIRSGGTNTSFQGQTDTGSSLDVGGGLTHNHSISTDSNLPPYIVCAIWIRTA